MIYLGLDVHNTKLDDFSLDINKTDFENNDDLLDKIKSLVGEKNLYLIVDCAINTKFKPLYYSDSEARILMADKYLGRFEDSAAHLVRLDLEDFFKQKETLEFIKQAIGQDWATFVISDKGLQELSIELKKVINIHNEVAGKDILFRFYDPRKINIFFKCLTKSQRVNFTNKTIGSLFTLGEKEISSYNYSKDDLAEDEYNEEDFFRFDAEFSARRDAVYLDMFFDECVAGLKAMEYADGYPEDRTELKKFVKTVHGYALEFDLDNELYAYELMALFHLVGADFDKDTKLLRVLRGNEISSFMKYQDIKYKVSELIDKINY